MTLYELQGEYLQLLQMAEDGDIDEQVFNDTLEAITGDIEYKADGYATVIKSLESDAALLKAEAERLTARRKAIENNIDRIKRNLENAMKLTGKTKFKTERFNFSIAKNAASLKLNEDIDVMTLPLEYVVFPKPEINKTSVKDALKAGASFEWAHLEQSESLRIK